MKPARLPPNPTWSLPVLLLGLWSASHGLTCIGDENHIMNREYQGENQLSCDTITVPYGDTATFMDGTTFSWDTRLESKAKVIVVKGTVIGMGGNGFTGSPDRKSPTSRWDGILVDSCGKVEFVNLVIYNATYALQIRSKDVHVGEGWFYETGGVLLPDSSVFRKEYLKDTIQDFRSGDLLAGSLRNYKCPDPPKQASMESSSWDWQEKVYWTCMGVLTGLGVWIWTLVIIEN